MKKTILITLISLAFIGCKKGSARDCWECSFSTSGIGGIPIIPNDTSFCIKSGDQIPLFSDINGNPLNSKCIKK